MPAFKSTLALLVVTVTVWVIYSISDLNEVHFNEELGPPGKVNLVVTEVASERRRDNEILFVFKVVIRNNSSTEITVKSQYYSAFSELGLVLMDHHGQVIQEQQHSWLLSLYSKDPRDFVLQRGSNKGEVSFVTPGLPHEMTEFRVKLKGSVTVEHTTTQLLSNEIALSVP